LPSNTGDSKPISEQINIFTAASRELLDAMDEIANQPDPDCEHCQHRLASLMDELAEAADCNVARILDNIIRKRISRRAKAELN
jgi:hypothetical protein